MRDDSKAQVDEVIDELAEEIKKVSALMSGFGDPLAAMQTGLRNFADSVRNQNGLFQGLLKNTLATGVGSALGSAAAGKTNADAVKQSGEKVASSFKEFADKLQVTKQRMPTVTTTTTTTNGQPAGLPAQTNYSGPGAFERTTDAATTALSSFTSELNKATAAVASTLKAVPDSKGKPEGITEGGEWWPGDQPRKMKKGKVTKPSGMTDDAGEWWPSDAPRKIKVPSSDKGKADLETATASYDPDAAAKKFWGGGGFGGGNQGFGNGGSYSAVGGPGGRGGSPGGGGSGSGSGGGEAGGLLSGAGAATAALAGIAIVGAEVIGAIRNLVGGVHDWVGALAPASILNFNLGLRDLQATLGTAVQPAFDLMSGVFRRSASILAPLLDRLQPVITQVIGTISGEFLSALREVTKGLSDLVPVVQPVIDIIGELASNALSQALVAFKLTVGYVTALGEAFGGFSDILEAGREVFASWRDSIEVWSSLLVATFRTIGQSMGMTFGTGGFIASVMRSFANGIRTLTESAIMAAARIASFFGQNGFINNLLESLRPGEDGNRSTAAVQDVAMRSFQDIATQFQLAAAQAGGSEASVQERENELRQRLIESLEALSEGRETTDGVLQEVSSAVRELLDWLIAARDTSEGVVSGTRAAARMSFPLTALETVADLFR